VKVAPATEISRRDLLRYFSAAAGCFVVGAAPAALGGCARPGGKTSRFSFPQGVASADPQSDAVVIWTRVEGDSDAVDLTAQIATDPSFDSVIAETEIAALPELDHTVRVLITELEPDRFYYYRFIDADGVASRTGRTRTAPVGKIRQLKIAVFSCQDYEQGYFTAYRRLVLDDSAARPEDRIDFVMHVGDFIYESIRGPDTIAEPDHNGNRLNLINRDGSVRRCAPFPSGGRVAGRNWIAPVDLDDYRWLYKKYLTDPDLQEARALYPFVQIWDDHELLNDYWQSYYREQSIAELKVASNQAWFEYVPAALSAGGRDGEASYASDFAPVDVTATPAGEFDDHYLSHEPNNLAAVNSMTIYRSLKWGDLAELFVIDGRSYRGPRGLSQELLSIGRHPYPEAPVDPLLIRTLNAGRTANGGSPPDEVVYLDRTLPNPRKDMPMGSMLGRRQKTWLKNGLKNSGARWKLMGLNVGLIRHGFDDSFREGGHRNGLLWTDGWDGYPVERTEICSFIRDERIANVVSLTGDRHAHLAGVIHDDFDADGPVTVMPEFAGGAVSAVSRMIIQRELSAHDPQVSKLVTFDGKAQGYDQAIMPSLNAWMLYGAASANAVFGGASPAEVLRAADPEVNPYMNYVDADAHGFLVARITRDRCDVQYVSVFEPVDLAGNEEAGVRRRVNLHVEAWSEGREPAIVVGEVEGEQPLYGLKA